jgi:hypothetical protein
MPLGVRRDSMDTRLVDQLLDNTFCVLEPNGQFWRSSPEDTSRHFISFGVIEGLSWMVLNIAVPILCGVGSSLTYDSLRKRLDIEDSKEQITLVLEKRENITLDNPEFQKIACEAITEHLQYHGWPKKEAREDADKTVQAIVEYLKTGE